MAQEGARQDQSRSEEPMSEYNSNALTALRRELKTKVVMRPLLMDMLEIPAGGFMNAAEALTVRNAESPMGQLIVILLGKGDKEFAIFCDMLRKSNHCAWEVSLKQKAESLRTGDRQEGKQSGWSYFWNLVTSNWKIIMLVLVVALICYFPYPNSQKDAIPFTDSQVPASGPTSATVRPSAHYNPSRPSDKQEHILQPSLRAHGTTTIMLPPMPTELKVISCVLLHNKVYISGTDTKGRQVQVYSLKNNTWSTLPEAPNYNAPIAIVDNRITLIGGRDVKTDKQSNVISTWFEEEERWKQILPSLPTMLAASEAYHHGNILLVTGGVEEGSSTAVDKVHVYNFSKTKWATPQQLRLPKALRSHHLVRLGEYIYLLGGATRFQDSADTTDKDHNLNAWKARWADIEEAVQHQDLTVQPTQHEKSIWESIADLPAPLPTVVLCGSSIISVGGKDNSSPVKAIYEFVDDNQWVKVGDMSVGRYNHGVVPLGTCGAALLVAGGFKWELYDEDTVKTTSVEMVLL